MKIAIGSDERTHLTDMLVDELRQRGHDVQLFGPLAEASSAGSDWPLVCGEVARAVAAGAADEGIVCCWTGTGARLRPRRVSGGDRERRADIAANKVPGIRAALCYDAETARGARVWNHANVLALSLRATSEPIAKEILDAWFSTPYSDDEWNCQQIERIRQLEHEAGARSTGASPP